MSLEKQAPRRGEQLAMQADPTFRQRRAQGATRVRHQRSVGSLLGGVGYAASGEVLRGIGDRLPWIMGLLLHELFLGGWNDVHHWLGEVWLHLRAICTHASYGVGALVMHRGHSQSVLVLECAMQCPPVPHSDRFK